MRQSDPMFVVILRLLIVLQSLLAPLLSLFGPLKRRRQFELQNRIDPISAPWPGETQIEWAFHSSSEGELEQLKPLIDILLGQNRPIELIYTSPSVEKRVQQLAHEHPQLIRALRLPLVTGPSLKRWSRASSLIMCRYDFFPNLLLLPVKRRILLWGSLKGKNPGPWSRLLYRHFDLVVAATLEQKELFLALGVGPDKLETYDFRPQQIQARLKSAADSGELAPLLELAKRSERVVFGSIWSSDFPLLNHVLQVSGKLHLWFAPHSLKSDDLERLVRDWKERYPSVPIYRVRREASRADIASLVQEYSGNKVVWLIEQPGRLLELYGQFDFAYVGGGFGRSIHSVLEPMIAGCWTSCGPRTHRSTEIDLANELAPGQVSVTENSTDFLSWWESVSKRQSALKDDNRNQRVHNWMTRASQVAGRILAK